MSRHFDDVSLGSIELFCLTAELQSFTAAAVASNLTPPAVSRTISRLEARLDVQLFVRTTRKVRLTEGGRLYFEQCKQALTQLVDAERELTGKQREPTGVVRMSLPTSYGHYRVLPLIPAFRERYPGIRLDLQLTNRNVDFGAEGYDLAIRGRVLPDSALISRRLENAALVVVGAPTYLHARGIPHSLQDLLEHECIEFFLPSTGQLVPWLFQCDGVDSEYEGRGSVRCIDDILAPVTLARSGAGLVQTYRFIVERDLAEGTLQEVLQKHAGASRPFSVLYPAHRHMPLRVRVLIDFLTGQLGG